MNITQKRQIYLLSFDRFCDSSTIHGTYYWAESSTIFGKLLWVTIVIIGISASGWIIDNSFRAWAQAPVITSVEQILIEQVPFPAITVCPLEKTR